MESNKVAQTNGRSKIVQYFKTLGIAGFLFFLVKGLIWLAIFWGVGKSC